MELKDLVGEHLLSGLDTFVKPKERHYDDDAQGFRFILDGVTYEALEDPSDGYRSYLKELDISNEKVSYTFPAQKVFGNMKDNSSYALNDVIQFKNVDTQEIVLEFGTDNHDDWYPSCVLGWYPENLPINK